jgi:hypothetical protein
MNEEWSSINIVINLSGKKQDKIIQNEELYKCMEIYTHFCA